MRSLLKSFAHVQPGADIAFRVMTVIPGVSSDSGAMIFARRQSDALAALGVPVKKFFLESRTEPVSIIREWLRLRREIENFKPNVLHCHYGTMTSFLAVCATRLPVVITYRGSDLNPVPSGNILRVLFGHVLSHVSAVWAKETICVSQELVGRMMWGKKRANVIPTGVDVSVFKPFPKGDARARLGLDINVPVVLFNAGRSPKVKRLDLAEASVAELKKALPDTCFMLLRGDTKPEDVPLYLNAADVLLVTSDFEGSPTTVQEAMACGLPVVSVAVGDVPERLRNVVPSRIVPRDPVMLGAALAEIIVAKQRSNGPEIAAKECSNEVVVAKVLEVLLSAAMPKGVA